MAVEKIMQVPEKWAAVLSKKASTFLWLMMDYFTGNTQNPVTVLYFSP